MSINGRSVQDRVEVRHSGNDERNQLRDALDRVRRLAKIAYGIWVSVMAVSLLTMGILLVIWIGGSAPALWPITFSAWTLFVLFAWSSLQNVNLVRNWMAAKCNVPDWLPSEFESVVALGDIVTPQGEVVDPRLFRSALAILLLSPYPNDRRLVRTPDNRNYSQALIAANDATLSVESSVAQLARQVEIPETEDIVTLVSENEHDLPDFSRPPGVAHENEGSELVKWIRALGINKKQLLLRIAALDIPDADIRYERMVKVALSTALPHFLGEVQRGTLASALRAAGNAVRALQGKAGLKADSTDWIRKLIAPPQPWLVEQLSRDPEQMRLPL